MSQLLGDVFLLRLNSKKKKAFLILIIMILVIFGGLAAISASYHGGIPVLNYHQINDHDHNSLTVSSKQFAYQMEYLDKMGYHTITPAELTDALENGAALPEKPILITFDDGYEDNYANAYPVLRQYNMKATIFLISDYVSTYPNYLTWGQAEEMQKNGIDFESHTLSHVELTKTESSEETLHQLIESKKAIDWRLKKDVGFIAYPCGSHDNEVEQLTQQAGYRAAFTVKYGLDRPGMSMYALDRIPIFGGNTHTMMRFMLRLRFTPLLSAMSQLRTDLIQNGHTSLASLILLP